MSEKKQRKPNKKAIKKAEHALTAAYTEIGNAQMNIPGCELEKGLKMLSEYEKAFSMAQEIIDTQDEFSELRGIKPSQISNNARLNKLFYYALALAYQIKEIEDDGQIPGRMSLSNFFQPEKDELEAWKTELSITDFGYLSNISIFNTMDRMLTHSGELKSNTRNHEKNEVTLIGSDTLRLTKETRYEKQEISIKNYETLFGAKRKASFIRLFSYTMQHMTVQNYPTTLVIFLPEMVKIGMYADTDGAYKALAEFTKDTRSIDFSWNTKKDKSPKSNIGTMFYNIKRNGNVCKISVNENIPVSAIAKQFTNFPKWGYQLSGKSFLLLRYIFYRARQSCKDIKEKKSFIISLDSVRDYMGIMEPKDVQERRYRQLIRTPIEKAVSEIMSCTERADNISIEIVPDENTNDIDVWLKGFLKIELGEEYAKPFATISENTATTMKRLKSKKAPDKNKHSHTENGLK